MRAPASPRSPRRRSRRARAEWANRLAAASIRSPRGERFRIFAACGAVRRAAARTRASASPGRPCGIEPQRRPRRVMRGELPRRESARVVAASSGAAASGLPSTRSISARGRPPGRSSTGASRQATMVDSRPSGVAPPSTIRSTRRRGRQARARRSSARDGPSGWPRARPPAGRRRARMARATG